MDKPEKMTNRPRLNTFQSEFTQGLLNEKEIEHFEYGELHTFELRKVVGCKIRTFVVHELGIGKKLVIDNCQIGQVHFKKGHVQHLVIKNSTIGRVYISKVFSVNKTTFAKNDLIRIFQTYSRGLQIVSIEETLLKYVKCLSPNLKGFYAFSDSVGFTKLVHVDTYDYDNDDKLYDETGDEILEDENSKAIDAAARDEFPSIVLEGLNIKDFIINGDLKEIQLSWINHKNLVANSRIKGSGSFEKLHCRGVNLHDLDLATATIKDMILLTIHISKIHIFFTINNLRIDTAPVDEETSSVGDLSIFELDGLSSLQLYNTVFNDLSLRNISAETKLSIDNVRVSDSLTIIDSNFDAAKISRLNLKNARMAFYNSVLNRCILTNIQWPHQYLIAEQFIQSQSPEDLMMARDSYRQLKVASLDVHNKFDALIFQKHEIRIHYVITKVEALKNFKLANFGSRTWWGKFEDYVVLSTNKIFSNFGLSWIRPFLFLIGITLLFHTIIVLNHPGLGISVTNPFLDEFSFVAFKEGFKLYLTFLSPVHDTEISTLYTGGHKVNVWGLPDFLQRVFSSFLIYYLLRGTRKFNF